jgi:hypothetical protein
MGKWTKPAIVGIKTIHTVIFGGLAFCVLDTFYAGLTGAVSRRTKPAILAVIVEAVIFWGNGQRCPLSDVVEDLGAEQGTVGDIFLPAWFARRLPVISSTIFGIGLVGLGVRRLARMAHRAAG